MKRAHAWCVPVAEHPALHTLLQQVQLGVISDAMTNGEWLKYYPIASLRSRAYIVFDGNCGGTLVHGVSCWRCKEKLWDSQHSSGRFPLAFTADGVQKTIELFGWTSFGCERDGKALSDATIALMRDGMKKAKEKHGAGLAGGYEFGMEYSVLNPWVIKRPNKARVVSAVKKAKVRVIVGALYEVNGLRFVCEIYKHWMVGSSLD